MTSDAETTSVVPKYIRGSSKMAEYTKPVVYNDTETIIFPDFCLSYLGIRDPKEDEFSIPGIKYQDFKILGNSSQESQIVSRIYQERKNIYLKFSYDGKNYETDFTITPLVFEIANKEFKADFTFTGSRRFTNPGHPFGGGWSTDPSEPDEAIALNDNELFVSPFDSKDNSEIILGL